MKKLENLNIRELSLSELLEVNGGEVDTNSFGYQLGAACANTVGNIMGAAKLVVDAFGDALKGKFFDKLFR